MNIQISIVIWTVICFVLLMIILRNWLFSPVIKIIDERNRKIEAARQKSELSQKLIKENSENVKAQKAEFEKQKKEQAKALAEQIYTEGKLKIDKAQKKRMKDVDEYRIKMQNDYEQIIASVSPEINSAAEAFAQKIISHRI